MTRLDLLRAQANPSVTPSSIDDTVNDVNIQALKVLVEAYDGYKAKAGSDFLSEEV